MPINPPPPTQKPWVDVLVSRQTGTVRGSNGRISDLDEVIYQCRQNFGQEVIYTYRYPQKKRRKTFDQQLQESIARVQG